MLALSALPQQVQVDATSIIRFNGPANVALLWTLTGTGTLTDAALCTGDNGQATARYTPDGVGTAFIEVSYGS